MKAREFLEQTGEVDVTTKPPETTPAPASATTDQNDLVQAIAAPFSIDKVKEEFQKKITEYNFSGIQVNDVKVSQEGVSVIIQQGSVTSSLLFCYKDEEVGPYVTVKPGNKDAINLDLTSLSPPIIDSKIGSMIDVSNLVWLSKEGFEGIIAAAGMQEVPVEQEAPPEVGSAGSGAPVPTNELPSQPQAELDAKTIPAPTVQGQPSMTYPGESLAEKMNNYKQTKMKEIKVSDLPVPVQHQIKVAKDTLKMPDPMARIMGGMTKQEAQLLLKKYGISTKEEKIKPVDKPLELTDPKYVLDLEVPKEKKGKKKDEEVRRVVFQKDGKETGVMDLEAGSDEEAKRKAKEKLKPDQKILSVGKPVKEAANICVSKNKLVTESKSLPIFRFIIREGKQIKINIGSTPLSEEMTCQKCGYEGDDEDFFSTMSSIKDKKHAVAACPSCGNKDTKTIKVTEAKKDNKVTNVMHKGRRRGRQKSKIIKSKVKKYEDDRFTEKDVEFKDMKSRTSENKKMLFKVNEYTSGYEVEHVPSGTTHWMSDGVGQDFTDASGKELEIGTEEFRQAWEDDLNTNPSETLEAYFPDLVGEAYGYDDGEEMECPVCYGKGNKDCPRCHGKGKIIVEKKGKIMKAKELIKLCEFGDTFHSGELVSHSQFGKGIVVEQVDYDSVMVKWNDPSLGGKSKSMVHPKTLNKI